MLRHPPFVVSSTTSPSRRSTIARPIPREPPVTTTEQAGRSVSVTANPSTTPACGQTEMPRAAMKPMGFTGEPLTYVSKCRWQPKELPVLPSPAMSWPALTHWP